MTGVPEQPESRLEKTVSVPNALPTYPYALPYRCGSGDNPASLSAPAALQESGDYSPGLMLQAGDDPRVLIGKRLGRITRT